MSLWMCAYARRQRTRSDTEAFPDFSGSLGVRGRSLQCAGQVDLRGARVSVPPWFDLDAAGLQLRLAPLLD